MDYNNQGGYFSHDAGARNSSKIIRLRMRYGAEGYGIYFMLLERLREERTYSCETDYEMLAFDFRVDANLIRAVVEDFNLFDIQGTRFYSRGFLERMAQKDAKASRRSAAGRKGMQSRWSQPLTQATSQADDNDTMLSESDNNVINSDNNVITMLSKSDNNVITTDNNVTESDNNVITMLSKNITSKVKKRKEKESKKDDVVVKETSSSSSSPHQEQALSSSSGCAESDHTPDDTIAEEMTALKLDQQWGEAIAMRYGIDGIELHAMINKWGLDCHANGRLHHSTLADAKSHFSSWLRIQQSLNRQQHDTHHRHQSAQARRGTAATAQAASQFSTRL